MLGRCDWSHLKKSSRTDNIFKKFLALINKITAYLHYLLTLILTLDKDSNKLNIYFVVFTSYIATLARFTLQRKTSFQPMILVSAGKSMRSKSSYITFNTNGPARKSWGALHVISSLRNHLHPRISPAYGLDNRSSSATGSLELFYSSLPQCSSSILRYWTHCICQYWSTRKIPYAYQFLFLL